SYRLRMRTGGAQPDGWLVKARSRFVSLRETVSAVCYFEGAVWVCRYFDPICGPIVSRRWGHILSTIRRTLWGHGHHRLRLPPAVGGGQSGGAGFPHAGQREGGRRRG